MTAFWAHGFRSEILPGWSDRSTLTLVGPTAPDGFRANLVVTRQPVGPKTSATAFGRAQVALLTQEIAEVELHDERTARFRGRELFQRMHTLTVSGRRVQQVQTYLVHKFASGPEGFVLTGSASPSAFDEVMPMFKRFIEAFEPFEPMEGPGAVR